MRRKTKTWLIALFAVVAIRAALPEILKIYINSVLKDDVEGYTGAVQDVDLSLWRGAYQLQGLTLKRLEDKIPVPFLDIGEVDLMLSWKALWKGHVVGRVSLDQARVNMVSGPDKIQTQTGAEGKGWQAAFDRIFPLRVDILRLSRSQIHYMDFHSRPAIDVYLKDMTATATNLTNIEKSGADLQSKVALSSAIQESGRLDINGTVDIHQQPEAFDLNMSVKDVHLQGLNDFFRAYGHFDVKSGRLEIYAEAAARGGRIKGYAKPFLTNVDVLQVKGDIQSGQEVLPELTASSVNLLLRRYSKDQSATKIPFEGKLSDPSIGLWPIVKNLFRHAFIRPLFPGIDHEITSAGLPTPPSVRKDGR